MAIVAAGKLGNRVHAALGHFYRAILFVNLRPFATAGFHVLEVLAVNQHHRAGGRLFAKGGRLADYALHFDRAGDGTVPVGGLGVLAGEGDTALLQLAIQFRALHFSLGLTSQQQLESALPHGHQSPLRLGALPGALVDALDCFLSRRRTQRVHQHRRH